MISKIASITYEKLYVGEHLVLLSLINILYTICKVLKNIIYLNCVTNFWWHVKFSGISLLLINFYIQLKEKENNSLLYLKILLNLIFKDYTKTINKNPKAKNVYFLKLQK